MTKQGLEEKIKNNESVWIVTSMDTFYKKDLYCDSFIVNDGYLYEKVLFEWENCRIKLSPLKNIFATKQQAQYYLDNIKKN